jgi:diacylglycerol kinase family enzyme
MHFQQVQVIINPASGKDEPILNPINDVFDEYEIPWDARVTHHPGDARRLTAEAIDAGADLIVCYGGDGTLSEVVNGMIGRGVPLGLLPGGTGNGVATALGIPSDLRQALLLIANSTRSNSDKGDIPRIRKLDVGRCGNDYFVQRAFIGLSDEYIPDRQMKNSVGFLAYPLSALRFLTQRPAIRFQITIDDLTFEEDGILCMVNNVGYSNNERLRDMAERLFLEVQVHEGEVATTAEGTVLDQIRPDDGLLDIMLLTNTQSLLGALLTLPLRNLDSTLARAHLFQGQHISIAASPKQFIALDGEANLETPGQIEVVPAVLDVIAPA